ncbi:ATP-binding SpoIIE family protein phosphatase [Cellulomonas citrea]|uniref:ATP-binding SpoIIE family protein phosphatase n=1 Tax=Cellulomonas citrea TaxID=1909423 RepID=UPI001F166A83|nr:ATP-binding SpoIIE family protein phosphatase [Cellulomonas citrea]
MWVNGAFVRDIGFTLEQLRETGLPMPGDPHLRASDPQALDEAIRARRMHSQAVYVRGPNGRWTATYLTLEPTSEPTGPIGWTVALQDLTSASAAESQARSVLASERRSLQVVAQVSELIVGLEDLDDLDPVARVLAPTLVDAATFVIEGCARRRSLPAFPRRGDDEDPVADASAGHRDGMAVLDLSHTYPAGSHAAAMVGLLRSRWSRAHAQVEAVLIAVPGRLGTIGMLAVVPKDGGGPRTLDAETLTALQLCARRVGTVVENIWLYERQRLQAETMQRAMLPQQAQIDGLDVWTYYAPNEQTSQIGGDWYDVMPISPRVAGVVIGDVVGHDVEAAAAMGQLRSVVRAYAFDVVEPAAVMSRVDQLVGGMGVPRAAGVVYSTLSRTTTGWRLAYTRAGHLPLLLLRDGVARFLEGGLGPLVGFGSGARGADGADLVPGDTLVYFTDGLVERRDRSLRDGLAELARVGAQVAATDAAGIGEDLLSRLVAVAEDDVAMVVVQVPSTHATRARTSSPRRRRWTLTSEPGSIRVARRHVARTCAAWGLPGAHAAELVVSELVANAVTHGWGHVSLQLHDTGEGLRIEVEDANPAPPVSTDGHPGRVGGFGMKIVEQLADWGWHSSNEGKVVWAKVRGDATER